MQVVCSTLSSALHKSRHTYLLHATSLCRQQWAEVGQPLFQEIRKAGTEFNLAALTLRFCSQTHLSSTSHTKT